MDWCPDRLNKENHRQGNGIKRDKSLSPNIKKSLLLLWKGDFSYMFSFILFSLNDLCHFASAGAPSGWRDRSSGAAAAESGPRSCPTAHHQHTGRVSSSQQLLQVSEQSVWWVKMTVYSFLYSCCKVIQCKGWAVFCCSTQKSTASYPHIIQKDKQNKKTNENRYQDLNQTVGFENCHTLSFLRQTTWEQMTPLRSRQPWNKENLKSDFIMNLK